MNEILRDRRHASIRLVMNPDRMVIREAQRTFTYLNLYGYLTDAVVVNRVFPLEVADGYFGEWQASQHERLADVRAGFAPVPIVTAPYLATEVIGPAMLDRLGGELFGDDDPSRVMYAGIAREISQENGTTTLRIAVPFAEKDQISVKKVDQELVVSAGREKRTIILPPALARRAPAGAKLEDGSLLVAFSGGE
jgi:arsenite-transporting ATPase